MVVIAGASSGIGRAAARAFAEWGCALVLAARRERALEEAARQCRSRGVAAIAVLTDATSAEAARRVVEDFAGIDAWVNNAAGSLFARFEEAPLDAFRRVIETNLFGTVHGSRAALRRFRERGRGVLINVASVVAHGRIDHRDDTLGQPIKACLFAFHKRSPERNGPRGRAPPQSPRKAFPVPEIRRDRAVRASRTQASTDINTFTP